MPATRKVSAYLHATAAFCLAVGGGAGCTRDFDARLAKPAPVASASEGGGAAPSDPARAWSAASCLRVLENTAAAPEQPARLDPAGREARRLATERLVELYAPALLADPAHALRPEAGPGGRTFGLRLRRGSGPGGLEPSDFASLVPADRFTVTGVPHLDRTPGEGAPLVGTRLPTLPVGVPGPVAARPVDKLEWAVTAVPVLGPAPARGGPPTVFLDLYDPHTTGRVAGPGGTVASLAADFTTPLAVGLSRLRSEHRALLGLLRGGDYFASAGLFPLEKPTPDKIPLVFVHGLISYPGDFRVLLNALTADAGVRRRYQTWIFYYPTSLPVGYSAMLLREDLKEFIHRLDPSSTHPALHRAVLVGHSMGGLLCRLAIVDGGDVYYRRFFRRPVGELRLTAEERALLRRAFFYRADPDVAEVVFIATPHHGSGLANGLPGTVGRLAAGLPSAVRLQVYRILRNNRADLVAGKWFKPASSLDSLSPRDPTMVAINAMPLRAGVPLHSILGDRGRRGPRERSSDGVVPYASAHLPQAESERLVPAGHLGTLGCPETAEELIRILRAAPRGGPGR